MHHTAFAMAALYYFDWSFGDDLGYLAFRVTLGLVRHCYLEAMLKSDIVVVDDWSPILDIILDH